VLTLVFSIPAARVMFIAAAMAFDTIVELADAFLNVLLPDVVWRVLMASVTGIAAKVVAGMAGHTTCVVVTIEFEMLVVVECRRRPLFMSMTLATVAGDLLVQRVFWSLVAGLASIAHGGLQQGVVEMTLLAEAPYPGVITMTRHTFLSD